MLRRANRKRPLNAVLLGIIVVSGWVWITSPITETPDISNVEYNMVNIMKSKVASETRNNTPLVHKEKIEDKQSHHHSNQTLEKMKKNMTILKANISGLENIIYGVNRSKFILDNKNDVRNIRRNNLKYANPHPFKYIINTEHACSVPDLFLIIYVHTAPANYKRRMVIRETWGNEKYYDVKVRQIFVMGKTTNTEAERALLFEAEQYGDIVQEDFQDTYKNLTYKGIAALKWITNYCSHAKFVLKTDDDIFVNMFTLLKHLRSMDHHGVNNKGLLLCLVWYQMTVMREGKWKVSKDQWKDNYYPTYCSGSAFTMSTDAAIAMHKVSYHVPFFWVDDFYITGLLPLKLNGTVKHKQFMSTYVLGGAKLEEKFTGPQWYTYIFCHVKNLDIIQSVWERLVQLQKGEVLPPIKFALPGKLPADDKKPNK